MLVNHPGGPFASSSKFIREQLDRTLMICFLVDLRKKKSLEKKTGHLEKHMEEVWHRFPFSRLSDSLLTLVLAILGILIFHLYFYNWFHTSLRSPCQILCFTNRDSQGISARMPQELFFQTLFMAHKSPVDSIMMITEKRKPGCWRKGWKLAFE